MLRRAPRLAKLLGGALDRFVAARFAEPRQQQVLGYPAVFLGTSPFRAPAMYHLMSHLDLEDGVYYPMGGFAALVDAMERLAREAGVEIETRATARRIITGPAGGTTAGRTLGSNAARPCCGRTPRAPSSARRAHRRRRRGPAPRGDRLLAAPLRSHPEPVWRRRDPGPSAVLVCLGVRGKLPELAHHNLLFTRDWKDNFGRIHAGRDAGGRRPRSTSASPAPRTRRGPRPADENLFILVPTPAAPDWGHGGRRRRVGHRRAVADAAIDQLAAGPASRTGAAASRSAAPTARGLS